MAVTGNANMHGRVVEQSDRTVGQAIEGLQKKIAEINATNEQLQEEHATALVQRRVSLSKINAAMQKAEEERENIRSKIAGVDNRLRIMTQGQKGGEPKTVTVRKVVGSLIPVYLAGKGQRRTRTDCTSDRKGRQYRSLRVRT
jgi:hypothetical protein